MTTYQPLQEEGPVLGWDGAIMSTYSSEVADWEGSGYGPLLATPSVRLIEAYSIACSCQAEYLFTAAHGQISSNEWQNLVLLFLAPCQRL